jgi:hypothetical protein
MNARRNPATIDAAATAVNEERWDNTKAEESKGETGSPMTRKPVQYSSLGQAG